MNPSDRVDSAIHQWREALGAEKVSHEGQALDHYARTTMVRGTRPCCVLWPTSTEDVQAVVRIAAEHGIVVYPLSRGKNWGYGDACAPTEGAAIVDLGRMNRIIEVNTKLAYAVIEPGVSQQQLYEHLQGHNTGLWMDSTGAGLDASLVGNTLERGFGHTRNGDHFSTTCGMEVVLADGRVLNTGFGHDPRARATHVYRYGVGPFLDGLFGQSNYGIITKIGLWLMPAPESFNFFYIRLNRHDDLAEFVERIRPLRLRGIIDTALHIANDLRLVSARRGYPWEEAQGRTPLPPELRDKLCKEAGVSPWIACGSLSGTKAQVRGARKALKQALAGFARPHFVDDSLVAMGWRVVRFLNKFGLCGHLAEQLGTLEPNYNLLKGIPTNEPMRGAQWRLRKPPQGEPADPRDLDSGLIWTSPVLPMTGEDAAAVMKIAEDILTPYGFEPLATFTMITERAMVAILNIMFDRTNAEEAARAETCYGDVVNTLLAAGYIPYRTGPQGMAKLRQEGDVFWEVTAQIKRALDPNDIIARGRYVPPIRP